MKALLVQNHYPRVYNPLLLISHSGWSREYLPWLNSLHMTLLEHPF